jgi:hypothetical protein
MQREKLTDGYVANLRPWKRAYYQIWDEDVRGLTVRVATSGRKTWFFTYNNREGTASWYHIGDAKTVGVLDARAVAERVKSEVAAGRDPHRERLYLKGDSRETRSAAAAVELVAGFARQNRDAFEAAPEPVVYFVKIGRAVKIGFTTNVMQRIHQYRHATGEPMSLLACLPGSKELERRIHKMLAGAQVAREFFEESAVRSFLEVVRSSTIGAIERAQAARVNDRCTSLPEASAPLVPQQLPASREVKKRYQPLR